MSLLSKIGFATVIVGIGWLCTDATQQTETPPLSVNEKMQEKLVNDYNVYALPLPESLDFAGEPVPLDDPDVRERMDRELLVNTYWQSNGLLIIKRAHKYFPIITCFI